MLHIGPWMSSLAAFASGALVNFVASRFWTWSRERSGFGRDLLGYALIAVLTAGAATIVTTATEAHTNGNAVIVELSYFATYGAMFVVKFVLLDRVLFRLNPRAGFAPAGAPAGAGRAPGP